MPGLIVGDDGAVIAHAGAAVDVGVGIDTLQPAPRARQTDAIILDPNYTGKTTAGLIDQVGHGGFDDDDNGIFIQTGGLPAVFTFAEQLAKFKQ